MVRLAELDKRIRIAADQLDANPWLLNCQNGTLDLRTGQLYEPKQDDLISKIAAVPYEPWSRSPVLDQVLDRQFGSDLELMGFVQRALGYSLTGVTSEEVFFMPLGPAATAKSTLIEALAAALGEYAQTTPIDTFLRRRNSGGPRDDLARLPGARLVTASEVPAGRSFDESFVKWVTGGDTVVARKLYCEPFEFSPRFKIWIGTNHRPRFRGNDDGMWRRVLVIPFHHQIPLVERDPVLKEHLKDPESGARAVLTFAVEGCIAWQTLHLGRPPAVVRELEAYRKEVDSFARFAEDRLVFEPASWTAWKEIADVYEEWRQDNRDTSPLNDADLRSGLQERGCTDRRKGGKRGWSGVRIRCSKGAKVIPLGQSGRTGQ